ncbi:MAG TPA: polysaccharide biosynthesis protein [Planctomycetes bacterium]|nr:polysaccharide biosynthesis protein [Planctomycetota bacterium]
MNSTLDKATVLITGGTGTLGRELVKHISYSFSPKKVIVYSRCEYKQSQMAAGHKDLPWLRFHIGDIRDYDRLKWSLRGVDYVVHAAAMKRIETCEYSPMEAVKTNVNGSANVVRACLDNDVKRAVLVSTDKAWNPKNCYGATKLTAEKMFLAANSYNRTEFRMIRYGNVLNSRGSVAELFLKLKSEGVKEFPITHPEMSRFWITIQQAAQSVLTILTAEAGTPPIYIPKLPSMKITDLAKAIESDCTFKIIGVTEGEKIAEGLCDGYTSDKNDWWMTAKEVKKILKISEIPIDIHQ